MSLRIVPEAEAELEAARAYLDQQLGALGSRFLDELGDVFNAIIERPLNFPKLDNPADDLPFRRALLARFRYAVIFECQSDEIVIVAVAHTSRDPDYWLGRLAGDSAG